MFAAHGEVEIPDTAAGGIYVSASKPADQTRPWMQLDQFGRPIRIYFFAAGAWLSRHAMEPGLTVWWFDTLPTLSTFDGGDGGPDSAISGKMWQQAKNSDGVTIEAKFPVAVGTLPSGASLAQGATGGQEKHVLTIPELPSITNTSNVQGVRDVTDNVGAAVTSGAAIQRYVATPIPGALSGNDEGHNTMPPFVVGYLLQRTNRQFYRVDA